MKLRMPGAVVAQYILGAGDIKHTLVPTRMYRLVRANLLRLACPMEIKASRQNLPVSSPIVVEKNRSNYGYVAKTDWAPEAVIVAGGATRSALMARGQVFAYVWAEEGALDINADDEIGCTELMEKLRSLLTNRIYGPGKGPSQGQSWPYIIEVYPFESYFVYDFAGDKYRQTFTLDPIERDVVLTGAPREVTQKFVDAATTSVVQPLRAPQPDRSVPTVPQMPRVDTGVRHSTATLGAPANALPPHYGAKNSELVTTVVRNWKSVHAAVDALLLAIKNGTGTQQMRPSFCPVDLTPEGKIVERLIQSGIDVVDFMKWCAQSGYIDELDAKPKKKAIATDRP